MTYRELKEKIESMPEEWLDKEANVFGNETIETVSHIDKFDSDLYCNLYSEGLYFEDEIDTEEFDIDKDFVRIAKEGDYFIFI